MIQMPNKIIKLASPRGFCAGVDRAIRIIEVALEKFDAPIYVRHEIVHNRFVVDSLAKKGVIFVDELSEVPADAPVIFSAHGVAKSVVEEAKNRNMIAIDATCPLVTKVHIEVHRHMQTGYHTLLIGHANHPEVEGTIGQVPEGHITLIEDAKQAESFTPPPDKKLAFATQTTLSVDDTAEIVAILKKRFPEIIGPRGEDICYATANRQQAVKAIAKDVDIMLVIGADNSSNSQRLVEVAKRAGAKEAILIADASHLDYERIDSLGVIGITAGASAPEVLVEDVLKSLSARYTIDIENHETIREDIVFNLPAILRD